MRLFAFIIVIGVLFAGCNALAQETTADFSSTTNTTPALTGESNEKAWSFSASAYTYFVPDDRDYVQPTLTADRGWLHLEARYNYEALDTSSLWIGYNYNVGDKVELELTPMLGGVFGDHRRHCSGLQGHVELVENWTLQRGRVSVQYRRFIRKLFLQLVGTDRVSGRLASLRPGDAAHASLPNGPGNPAWIPRRLLVQTSGFYHVCFQPG